MLREADFDPVVIEAEVDDSELQLRTSEPAEAAMALAWLKAAAGAQSAPEGCRVVLGADTFVVKNGRIIGKPIDEADSRRIVRLLTNGEHEVLTGVAVALLTEQGEIADRVLLCDAARVSVGDVAEEAVEAYIQSGNWRGKAGAYNFSERVAAGWPLTCDGDPTTVMGLPMLRLAPLLRRLRDADFSLASAAAR